MNIIATDEKGNTFVKRLKLRSGDSGTIVSLGFPCEWYLEDIKTPPIAGDNKMLVDIGGRNHKGSPVYVSHKELIEAVEALQEAR